MRELSVVCSLAVEEVFTGSSAREVEEARKVELVQVAKG